MRLRDILEPSKDAPYGTFQIRAVERIYLRLKDDRPRLQQALLVFYTLNCIAHSKEFRSPQFDIDQDRLSENCGLSIDTIGRVLPILGEIGVVECRKNVRMVDGKRRIAESTIILPYVE